MTKDVERTCMACSKPFRTPQWRINRGLGKFCSRDCSNHSILHRHITPLAVRFWRKVDRTTTPDGCWVWIGTRTKAGYGQIGAAAEEDSQRVDSAHRVGYQLQVGPIPEGLWVLHRCDNPPCVRGDHLFVGTVAENNRDMAAKGRHWMKQRPNEILRGVRHHAAKMTDAQVIELRRLRRDHHTTYKELGSLFGISAAVTHSIAAGRTWRHVLDS